MDYLDYIDPNKVFIINDNQNFKTYTFGLTISESDRLTNIAIKETLSNLKIYTVKYFGDNYEQWINDLKNLGITSINPEIEIKDLSKFEANCVDVSILMDCPSGQHHSINDHCDYSFSDWTFSYVITPRDCNGSGGNDGGNSGNSNTGPNSGGGGGGTTPINTSPVTCVICPVQSETIDDTPCEQLKEITDNASIMSDVNQLKPKTQTIQESAISIVRKYNAEEGKFYNSVGLNSNGSHFSANAPTGGLNIANAHNHPIDGQSIPSWGDVNWLNNCENEIRNIYEGLGLSTNIVVVRDAQIPANDPIIYAIKINDKVKLNNQVNSDITNIPSVVAIPDENLKIEKMNDIYGQFYKNTQNNTIGLEKKFLELFQNYGVSLFKYDSNTDKWSKLNLLNPYNPLNPDAINPVISKPCNQ